MIVPYCLQQQFGEAADLPSPLCGMLTSLVTDPLASGDIGSLAERVSVEFTSGKKNNDKVFFL